MLSSFSLKFTASFTAVSWLSFWGFSDISLAPHRTNSCHGRIWNRDQEVLLWLKSQWCHWLWTFDALWCDGKITSQITGDNLRPFGHWFKHTGLIRLKRHYVQTVQLIFADIHQLQNLKAPQIFLSFFERESNWLFF